jgi:hypothetical protein
MRVRTNERTSIHHCGGYFTSIQHGAIDNYGGGGAEVFTDPVFADPSSTDDLISCHGSNEKVGWFLPCLYDQPNPISTELGLETYSAPPPTTDGIDCCAVTYSTCT